MFDGYTIAVVIPTFKARSSIMSVIHLIGAEVDRIYVVDDCCPQKSGDHVDLECKDRRVVVIRHDVNQGVGGAVMTGYTRALADDMDVIVKIDSDCQMDPRLIMNFVIPIIDGQADYSKGNRFYDLEKIRCMPRSRLFGNAVLSLMTKISSGYWNIFDPTNGFTAIHADIAKRLPFQKISRSWFFETDMLFRLNTLRAVVIDVQMDAKYDQETSNLRISGIIGEFFLKHLRNSTKRIFYNYYLRDMSLASIQLPLGIFLIGFGSIYGVQHWIYSAEAGTTSPAGTAVLSAFSLLAGINLILSFVGYDVASIPVRPVHSRRRRQNLKKIGDLSELDN